MNSLTRSTGWGNTHRSAIEPLSEMSTAVVPSPRLRGVSDRDRSLHSPGVNVARARLRSFVLTPRPFRRLALGALAGLWVIVVTGAVVRLTASGLGCEHWPGCQAGQPFPEKGYHSYIEFGNRVVGGVAIVLSLAVAIGA